ncbi:MAG: nucleotide exchange factor GrpE [Phycisphaeraceae bacterium]|nr:nucleotide exchange factor GrpE [Phycisphaeraceae bacterium]MCB9847998.1 nucleotide exchange factor GrpE [Phycisphaeraceae bacterium]
MPRKKKNDPDHQTELETEMEAAGHEETATTTEDSIEARLEALEAAVEEANNKALRTLADFQNYKKRALIDERLAHEEGAASVLAGVITVLDHFDRALGLDPETTPASAVLDGVRLIRNELLKSIADRGVALIDPKVGDEFNPGHHQAVGSLPAPGVAPGHVSMVHQQGYAIGDRVLRPATVMIAPEAEASVDTEA